SSWPAAPSRRSSPSSRPPCSGHATTSSIGASTRSSTSRSPDPARLADAVAYELGENRYGKSRIRLVTVRRRADRHDFRDLTVDVALEGDFTAAHVAGDNAGVIATDTMKNTVYAFAKDQLTGAPESFGLALARHFGAAPQVTLARIGIRE